MKRLCLSGVVVLLAGFVGVLPADAVMRKKVPGLNRFNPGLIVALRLFPDIVAERLTAPIFDIKI